MEKELVIRVRGVDDGASDVFARVTKAQKDAARTQADLARQGQAVYGPAVKPRFSEDEEASRQLQADKIKDMRRQAEEAAQQERSARVKANANDALFGTKQPLRNPQRTDEEKAVRAAMAARLKATRDYLQQQTAATKAQHAQDIAEERLFGQKLAQARIQGQQSVHAPSSQGGGSGSGGSSKEQGGILEHLKASFGRGSTFKELTDLAAGGGVIAGLSLAGDQVEKLAGGLAKFQDGLHDTSKSAIDVATDLGSSLPILGGWFRAGLQINEILTGNKELLDTAKASVVQGNKDWADRLELTKKGKEYLKEYADALNEIKDRQRTAFLEGDDLRAEQQRQQYKKENEKVARDIDDREKDIRDDAQGKIDEANKRAVEEKKAAEKARAEGHDDTADEHQHSADQASKQAKDLARIRDQQLTDAEKARGNQLDALHKAQSAEQTSGDMKREEEATKAITQARSDRDKRILDLQRDSEQHLLNDSRDALAAQLKQIKDAGDDKKAAIDKQVQDQIDAAEYLRQRREAQAARDSKNGQIPVDVQASIDQQYNLAIEKAREGVDREKAAIDTNTQQQLISAKLAAQRALDKAIQDEQRTHDASMLDLQTRAAVARLEAEGKTQQAEDIQRRAALEKELDDIQQQTEDQVKAHKDREKQIRAASADQAKAAVDAFNAETDKIEHDRQPGYQQFGKAPSIESRTITGVREQSENPLLKESQKQTTIHEEIHDFTKTMSDNIAALLKKLVPQTILTVPSPTAGT